MTKTLSKNPLLEQEAIIERGLASFIEVGNALMRIRDEELYREAGFGGFVEYLESKQWELSPSRAYQMIDSASVSTMVETSNERHARELAPLMRNATPEIVKQVYTEVVVESDGRPTASRIRDKVQSIVRSDRRKPQERPSQYLPDLLDEDSPRNLRTQIVKWCELGRHIESLLENRTQLEPKSAEDLALIRSEIRAMAKIVQRLEEKVK